MPHARPHVDNAISTVLGRERDDPVEILAARVSRAVDVRGRGAAELLLDRVDPAQSASSFAYSTVFSRRYPMRDQNAIASSSPSQTMRLSFRQPIARRRSSIVRTRRVAMPRRRAAGCVAT